LLFFFSKPNLVSTDSINCPLFSGFSINGINKYKNDAINIDNTITRLSLSSQGAINHHSITR